MRSDDFARFLRVVAASAVLVLAGCASTPERNALPAELIRSAGIPGVPEARFWGDDWPKYSRDRFTNSTDAQLQQAFPAIYGEPLHYLAISGGGANGAFGAGLLVGWTASGQRPEFSMVTGISTGALIAPFAFLGPDYDEELKTVYTTISTRDIARKRGFLSIPFNDSVADTTPLRQLIAKHVDAEMIAAIARENGRGRRLFIGTVNLDASRSVIWNIGAIADSDYAGKVNLIHDILQASSAIPVAFPPVAIEVEAAGRTYDELHVDGGTGAQVFVYPASVDWRFITQRLKTPVKPQVYVIRNAFLEPDYQGVKRKVAPIASRTVDSLIRTQSEGDLYEIFALCRRDGNEFNLAYIPSDFTEEPTEGFDPVYMGKLFQLGYDMAINGYPWEHAPPGFDLRRRRWTDDR
jgi:predicted patatin/cPLA2 family phospholipase